MKHIKPLFLSLIGVFFVFNMYAQSVTISGYVKDGGSGETIGSAAVYAVGTTYGSHTNEYGYYSLTLPTGTYTLRASYIGLKTIDSAMNIVKSTVINFNLKHNTESLKEVVVNADRRTDENVKNTDMGKVELNMETIKTLPVVFGESDVLKIIQLLPGVQSGGEGSTGFYVRGGGADQNLILLDEAVVYNASHLFGFFSIFNTDAIKSTTFYKEGMPAQYEGRISSVVDIAMKDGNDQQFHVSGGIGLIASRIMLEGPIKKNKCSFLVSARRTYIDQLIKPFIAHSAYAGTGYYFYDLNGKVSYRFSNKDRLYLSGYYGKDVFNYAKSPIGINIPWGNATATLRWNHVISPKLFMNVSAIYNQYQFDIDATFNNFEFVYASGIKTWNGKCDFDYNLNALHKIKFGALYEYTRFYPGTFSGSAGSVNYKDSLINVRRAEEVGLYAQDVWSVNERFEINGGVRVNLFTQVGPYDQVFYNQDGSIASVQHYSANQNIATYIGADPRLLMRYTLNKTSSLKAGYTYIHQYVHLVSQSGTTLPTDIWVPSTNVVKPQLGSQYSAGYFRNFKDNMFETSVEVYYKSLRNQIEYSQTYNLQPSEDIQDAFVFGKGQSYGIEFYINKQYGRLTGWISYTLSKTTETFNNMLLDEQGDVGTLTFPARYDRPNNLSVVASYKLTSHWNVGGEFIYQSGFHYTPVIGRAFIDNNLVDIYGIINSAKMPAYNRLDISFRYTPTKHHKNYESSWSFDVYNVYDRQNPYFIYYNTVGNQTTGITQSTAVSVTIFPILPSVTWNFKF